MSTIWSLGGANRFPSGPSARVEAAIRAILAHPEEIDVAVPPYGTPLNVAVMNLSIGIDGSANADSSRQEELMRVVRVLVSHGARFSSAEAANLKHQ